MLKLNIKKEGFFLLPGGQLIRSRWVFNHKTNHGKYVLTDETKNAINYLYRNIEFYEEITLRDIFDLFKTNQDLIKNYEHYYLNDFLTEASKFPKLKSNQYHPDNIEYLEVYRVFTANKRNLEMGKIGFHGVGFLLKEDFKSGGDVLYRAGNRINWGISQTDLSELLDLPIKISNKLVLYDEIKRKSLNFINNEYNLGAVLDAIFYELTWHGGPKQLKEFKKKEQEELNKLRSVKTKTKKNKNI